MHPTGTDNVGAPSEGRVPKTNKLTTARAWCHVAFALLAYWIISLAIVFVNRQLFTSVFRYPLFISWYQQVVGAVILSLAMKWNTSLHYDFKEARIALPVNITFVGMVALANLCLKHVQISTYQVARSLTLAYNLLLSSLLGQHISPSCWIACGIVSLGFLIGSIDTATLSFTGCVLGAVSSFFSAGYTVCIKNVLPKLYNDEVLLLYYNLVFASIVLLPMVFIGGETSSFSELLFKIKEPGAMRVWLMLFLTGVLGLSVTFITYYCVRITSPVSFTVCGYAKSCAQSVGGIAFLGDVVTIQSVLGILLTVFGSLAYFKIKLSQTTKKTLNDTEPNKELEMISPRKEPTSVLARRTTASPIP